MFVKVGTLMGSNEVTRCGAEFLWNPNPLPLLLFREARGVGLVGCVIRHRVCDAQLTLP